MPHRYLERVSYLATCVSFLCSFKRPCSRLTSSCTHQVVAWSNGRIVVRKCVVDIEAPSLPQCYPHLGIRSEGAQPMLCCGCRAAHIPCGRHPYCPTLESSSELCSAPATEHLKPTFCCSCTRVASVSCSESCRALLTAVDVWLLFDAGWSPAPRTRPQRRMWWQWACAPWYPRCWPAPARLATWPLTCVITVVEYVAEGWRAPNDPRTASLYLLGWELGP